MANSAKIVFQGQETPTSAPTVGAFLKERGLDPANVIVDYKGEAVAGGPALDSLPLEDGATLDVFSVVSGG